MADKISISTDALDKTTTTETDKGDVSNCTHPAGHCFGSDGGSGIPENLKVAPGGGGEFRIQQLSPDKTKLVEDAIYLKCQYCGKYMFSQTYEEKTKETIN